MSDVYTTPDILYRIRNKETGAIVTTSRSTTGGWYETLEGAQRAITQQGSQPRYAPASHDYIGEDHRWYSRSRAEIGLPVYPDDRSYRDAVFEVVAYRVTEISLQEATGG